MKKTSYGFAFAALAFLSSCGGAVYAAGPTSGIVDKLFVQKGAGAIAQTYAKKLQEKISVADFGADGSDTKDDTAAFMAAMATGKTVFVPEGTYYVASTINVGYAQGLWGAGRGKTIIKYTGTGTAIYAGAPGNISLIYDIDLRDFTIFSTNMATRGDYGIKVENAVYFNINSVTILGPGSPNDATPANRVLSGVGLYLSNNSIIGRISHTSVRLWDTGIYLKTLPTSQSYWTAAIIIDGQGELADNMKCMVIGDPTVAMYSGVGVSVRDMSFQSCYDGGLFVYSGDNTVIENNYFEGNGTSDIVVGGISGSPAPIGVKILKNTMNAEGIGATPYASQPYVTKIKVVKSSFTAIRDNNMSISRNIPLISVNSLADSTVITGNRLNSTAPVGGRISNAGTYTSIDANFPNQQPSAKAGTFSRTMTATAGTVSYTGLGFRPTSIAFTASIDGANQKSDGLSAGGVDRSTSIDGSGLASNSAYAIKIIRPTAADAVMAQVVSYDEDGFTLNWTATGAPPGNTLTVNYLARK
jgi:hypothetical protein